MTNKQELLRQAEKHIADLEIMVALGEERENELEQALNMANIQYEKVIEQNKSLQQENKQLKRKEQECEELINKNNILETELNQIKLLLEWKNTQYSQLKKEKTEIKKYLGISSKTILERLEELTDFRDKDKEQLDQLEAENEILKEKLVISSNTDKQTIKIIKALDEIEKYLKTQLDGFGNAVYSVDKSAIKEISDIINNTRHPELVSGSDK